MILTRVDVPDLPFPDFYCKYAALSHVKRRNNDLVNTLLDCTPTRGGRRYTSVDVKVQHLKLNETTCLPGWHCDTISDPDAIHHLYVIGENRTEFKTEDGIVAIPDGCFVTYGFDQPHRGPETTVAETRFLFRVTESNVVRGGSNFKSKYPFNFRVVK